MAAGKFDSLDTAAMPFVTVGDDDKFEVNPEAVRYLKTLTGKVAVVSIAGEEWRPCMPRELVVRSVSSIVLNGCCFSCTCSWLQVFTAPASPTCSTS